MSRMWRQCNALQRYGWHGKDQELQRNYTVAQDHYPWLGKYRDRSITEVEFLHGHLNSPGSRPACFAFRDKVRERVSRADSRIAPTQWETALLCNDVSHWLGASLESALVSVVQYMNELIKYTHLDKMSILNDLLSQDYITCISMIQLVVRNPFHGYLSQDIISVSNWWWICIMDSWWFV